MKRVVTLKEPVGTIQKPADLFTRIKSIRIDFRQEHVLVFYLDTRHQVISHEVLFKGGLNVCAVCPNTLFRRALHYGSAALILAHNHPSGVLSPSEEDRKVFRDLQRAGRTLSIPVLDFIIFKEGAFYALSDE